MIYLGLEIIINWILLCLMQTKQMWTNWYLISNDIKLYLVLMLIIFLSVKDQKMFRDGWND